MKLLVVVIVLGSLLLVACGSKASRPEPTSTVVADASSTVIPAETGGSRTATATEVAPAVDAAATVELTGAMVDTVVTVAVYTGTEPPPANTACVDLVTVIVPSHAVKDVEWEPADCTFDLRTWTRLQFRDIDGVWFVQTVMILFPLSGQPPESSQPPMCATWRDVLISGSDDPASAPLIGSCSIVPLTRDTPPTEQQIWARILTSTTEDPDPDTPCWHLAPTYDERFEGFTRPVLCRLQRWGAARAAPHLYWAWPNIYSV